MKRGSVIPSAIKREHILASLSEIDRVGVLPRRDSTKFHLVHEGKKYPPKYAISLAAKYAIGAEFPSSSFGGGSEANEFLMERGFDIVPIKGDASVSGAVEKPARKQSSKRQKTASSRPHNERCSDCKTAVELLLRALYGDVKKNHRIDASTDPEDYRQSPLYAPLSEIYRTLQTHRGHTDFVRSATMAGCDFWIPSPGFVVEFDESQHFTKCRALTLERYPRNIPFGFETDVWLRRCERRPAEDHNPPYRDEQRAWYDTLRDFVPHIQGLHPTIRLFAGEFAWCSLKPEITRDIETFRQILGERANFWKLEFAGAQLPVLARIVVDGPWRGDLGIAAQLLEDICLRWPKDKKVKCLTTCGAFLRFDWPRSIARQADNRSPDQKAMMILESDGGKCCDALLKDSLAKQLKNCTDYLTLGVDSVKDKISFTGTKIPEPHAELVYVVNLLTGARQVTSKSYPTSGQEKGLLRNSDLRNHFMDLQGNRTMVLGCHDLTIFNPRSDAKATGWRQDAKQEFKNLAAGQRPTWVLHHPHTTVKTRTWLMAWGGLKRFLPSVESYVGSGAYSNKDFGWDQRNSLSAVLASTRSEGIMDVIVHMAQP
jgi:hypothetical protein